MFVELLAVAWAAGQYIGSRTFPTIWTKRVKGHFAEGPAQWKSALCLPTQVLIFPGIVLSGLIEHGSMEGWGATAGGVWGSASSRAFLYGFALFLLLDFVIIEREQLRSMFIAHHIVCLVGHCIAASLPSRAWPWYLCGAVTLELGSASCNYYCLHANPHRASKYVAGMTLSNLSALACMLRFVQLSGAGTVTNASIACMILTLTFFRQKEAWLVWNKILPGMPWFTSVV